MNIQDWNFDFASLPSWPNEQDSDSVCHELYEHPSSDLACIIYSIIENTMCKHVGCLAILQKKEKPVLYLAIRSFLVPQHQISFSSSGSQIFLQTHIDDEFLKTSSYSESFRQHARPLLVLDVAQNRFAYIRTHAYNPCYSIKEVTPHTFSVVLNDPQTSNQPLIDFSKKTIDLRTLEWFPVEEIESLSAKYFGRPLDQSAATKSKPPEIKQELSGSEHKRPKKKAKVQRAFCVSCGVCLATCPTKAISMFLGIHAHIDAARCVGCGKCALACPASVIKMREVAP